VGSLMFSMTHLHASTGMIHNEPAIGERIRSMIHFCQGVPLRFLRKTNAYQDRAIGGWLGNMEAASAPENLGCHRFRNPLFGRRTDTVTGSRNHRSISHASTNKSGGMS